MAIICGRDRLPASHQSWRQSLGLAIREGLILGICNGFQILLETGLLPGGMLRNAGLSFICEDVYVRVENAKTPFTNICEAGQVIKLPIAHAEGNYYTDPVTLSALQANAQIVFRYCDKNGQVNPTTNPNGSIDNIAGIRNAQGNVLGLMPHPERCGGKPFWIIKKAIFSFNRW